MIKNDKKTEKSCLFLTFFNSSVSTVNVKRKKKHEYHDKKLSPISRGTFVSTSQHGYSKLSRKYAPFFTMLRETYYLIFLFTEYLVHRLCHNYCLFSAV